MRASPIVVALTVIVCSTVPAAADPLLETTGAGAASNASGGAAWASFKQIDVREQRSSRAVFVAQNAQRERTAGSPAAAVTRQQHSGRPNGCFGQTLSTSAAGTVRVLEVCPGEGGYRGLAGEAFGISVLTLRDPVTGEPIATGGGTAGQTELIVIDPLTLAQRAAAALDLPSPAIRMSPADDQVVQLPSWLWIPDGQWQPQQVSASAGPVTSTVTATPVRVTWDMGNGDTVDCDGPGTPYRARFAGQSGATDCSYTYRYSSAGQPGESYQVTSTVAWELTWTATGAAGGGGLGTVETSAAQPVRVTEIQALVQ